MSETTPTSISATVVPSIVVFLHQLLIGRAYDDRRKQAFEQAALLPCTADEPADAPRDGERKLS